MHRGALVGLGYWNDAEKTAERYKLLPAGVGGREAGLQLPEFAVFSGDTVRRDADGFLYFIGRRDEMIKTSGYRVSPTEVEEVLYATRLVGECAAFGVEHATLGQAIQVIATAAGRQRRARRRRAARRLPRSACRPTWCRPAIDVVAGPLPRNPNGKIDRKLLRRRRCAVERQRRSDAHERAPIDRPTAQPRACAPMDQFAVDATASCVVGGQRADACSPRASARRPFYAYDRAPAARARGRAARRAAGRRSSCTTR